MTQKADESYIKNKQCLSDALSIREDMYEGNIPIDHVSIGHHQPQRSVPRGFPLFKHCEWLIVNCNLGKRTPLVNKHNVLFSLLLLH